MPYLNLLSCICVIKDNLFVSEHVQNIFSLSLENKDNTSYFFYGLIILFRGLPLGRIFIVIPKVSTKWLRNFSDPIDFPLIVDFFITFISSSLSGLFKKIAYSFLLVSSCHIGLTKSISLPVILTLALDHRYSSGLLTIFARTGFRSIFRPIDQRYDSLSTKAE